MPVWLVSFLAPVWQFLLKYGIGQLVAYFKKQTAIKEAKSNREAAFAKAKEKYNQAGNNPDLTPEQKQKEQEDAFNDFINSTRNAP